VPVQVRVLCDCKISSINFLKAKRTPQMVRTCMFPKVADVVVGHTSACTFHNAPCVLPDTPPDIACLGFPCQPFSGMRANRASVLPHMHKDFDAYLQACDYLRIVRPRCGFLENVIGFGKVLSGTHDSEGRPLPDSWLLDILDVLDECEYVTRVFKLDNGTWIEAPRERFSGKQIVFLSSCMVHRRSAVVGQRRDAKYVL
jgi:site-specific DNA-cytosine methylase